MLHYLHFNLEIADPLRLSCQKYWDCLQETCLSKKASILQNNFSPHKLGLLSVACGTLRMTGYVTPPLTFCPMAMFLN